MFLVLYVVLTFVSLFIAGNSLGLFQEVSLKGNCDSEKFQCYV